MVRTLAAVAGTGYTAVEFAGFGEASLAEIQHVLVETGLTPLGAHMAYGALYNDLDRVIADIHALQCQQVAVPAFSRDVRDTPDKAMQLAEALNVIGQRLRHEGIAFAYHNEDYDFAPLGNATLWEMLVANTDAAFVDLQLDVWTAIAMGVDLINLMRQHGKRITSIHVCDRRDNRYVPIGQGDVDWPALLAAAHATACRWVVVEHDAPANPLETAKASLDALMKW